MQKRKRYDVRRLLTSKILNPPDYQPPADPFARFRYDASAPVSHGAYLFMDDAPNYWAYLRMRDYDRLPRWERDILKEGARHNLLSWCRYGVI